MAREDVKMVLSAEDVDLVFSAEHNEIRIDYETGWITIYANSEETVEKGLQLLKKKGYIA